MIIVVLRLITGDEIIGQIECEDNEEFMNLEALELFDPMWVVPAEFGSMKLRDALMLSDDVNSLMFYSDDVITAYSPSKSFIMYYTNASKYAKEITRPSINLQIETAAAELKDMIHDEKEYAADISQKFRKTTGTKLH